MIRRWARSIGSTSSPVASITRVAGSGSVELPVGVHAARTAALDEQVARALGQERPQRGQLAGLVDVDPQPAGLADRVLVAARRRPHGRGEEHLLAPVGVPRREREQRLQPLISAGPAAGQEVVGAPAGRDLQPPVAAGAGGELDQPVGLLVQESRAAARGGARARARRRRRVRQRAGRGSAAPRAGGWRGAGRGRRWLRASDPPCSGMGSPGLRPGRPMKRPAVR